MMSAQLLEVPLVGVGTVPRLEGDEWSTVKKLRQATNEYALPPSPPQQKTRDLPLPTTRLTTGLRDKLMHSFHHSSPILSPSKTTFIVSAHRSINITLLTLVQVTL